MTEIPIEEDAAAPKSALQRFILVAWALAAIAWAWWWAFWVGVAAAEPRDLLGAGAMLLMAVFPAVLVIWKYPTGWVFRSVFGAVALSLPLYFVVTILAQ